MREEGIREPTGFLPVRPERPVGPFGQGSGGHLVTVSLSSSPSDAGLERSDVDEFDVVIIIQAIWVALLGGLARRHNVKLPTAHRVEC